MEITHKMVEQAYPIAKKVWEDAISLNDARDEINKTTGMEMNSAKDFIYIFLSMMKGEKYTRTFNNYANKLLFDKIFEDYGKEFCIKALDAAEKHAEYYSALGKGDLIGLKNLIKEQRGKMNSITLQEISNHFDTSNTPRALYHYTSINTLGYILKNRNIRFNNLSAVDDLDEAYFDGYPWGQYCFVSSWTSEKKESIPMWKMYSDNLNGVRIRLKSNPFHIYKEHNSYFPLHELVDSGYSVKPLLIKEGPDALLRKIFYVDDINEGKQDYRMYINEEMIFHFITTYIGMHKSNLWKFQEEWRYMFFIIPMDMTGFLKLSHYELNDFLKCREEELAKKLLKGEPVPYKDYYLNIDDAAFKDMEIVIGPKANEIDQEVVHLLVNKYNPDATVRISELHGRIS